MAPDIRLITENLADELIPGIGRAAGIYILTSFVMESGVKLLQPHLKAAAERGAEIQILAGDYLFVTQPQALRRLLAVHENIQARLWRSRGASFHPKAYLFDYTQGQGLMIVGSSNLSLSAFRLGYEWNLAVSAEAEPYTFEEALEQFTKSFNHEQTCELHAESIAQYEKEYWEHHGRFPELARIITETEEAELMMPVRASPVARETAAAYSVEASIEPRPAQKAALEALGAVREDGYDKAMVVMATGLGKTYLAAFFARPFHRVLFIAHRDEILRQAQQSFTHVMPERSIGFYKGSLKNVEAELVFASIYTLGLRKNLEAFSPDAFDLIVVDEFHHAAAKTYISVLDYFQPGFLLGITATPDRLDGKDVYALCEGNVAYELHFLEAITRGWLSPFHYYGVYDDIDYSRIAWLGTRYDEAELLAAQLREERAEKIYRSWTFYKQTRTIAFCSSIRQADYLSNYFGDRRVRTASLHSGLTAERRTETVRALQDGDLDIVFTVDLLNEGVDIPRADTLLFVRPTESLTVFTQQIGRGLRLAEDKSHCTIIDLIGNYRNADLKLGLFHRGNGTAADDYRRGRSKRDTAAITAVPASCLIELEVGVVNLLAALSAKRQPRKEKLLLAYMELKQEWGRRPTYLELHLHGREPAKEYKRQFKTYVGFLLWAGELSVQEREVFAEAEGWLRELEETTMTRSYKLVLLLAMLERGPACWSGPITAREAAPFFHRYLTEKEYRGRKEFANEKRSKLLGTYDEEEVAKLIVDMPMKYWSDSAPAYLSVANGTLSLNPATVPKFPLVHEWTRQICEYRLQAYFERSRGSGE